MNYFTEIYKINQAYMRARFVFEKFSETGDPIEDLGISLIHRYFEIKNLLANMNAHGDIEFEQFDYDKDEFTIRTDSSDILELSDFRSRGHRWEELGIENAFVLNYYIDVILRENKLIRSFELTNDDIPDFQFWDEKVLTNKVLETSDDEISKMIIDDNNSIYSSDALIAALVEAWDLAKDQRFKPKE
jgi:hypothetical protein